MSTSTRIMAVVMTVVGLTGLGTGSASAVPEGALVPLGLEYRSCDFVTSPFVPSTGIASGNAVITTGGANTVTADVSLAIAIPNTPYQVRLIQGPRPGTQTCNRGDPGVASTVMNIDGNGVGRVTLSDARRPGATNAWVFVESPPLPGRIRGDFYTSDLLTTLG